MGFNVNDSLDALAAVDGTEVQIGLTDGNSSRRFAPARMDQRATSSCQCGCETARWTLMAGLR